MEATVHDDFQKLISKASVFTCTLQTKSEAFLKRCVFKRLKVFRSFNVNDIGENASKIHVF